MIRSVVILGLFLAWIAPSAFCGPPFLTDDPQPVAHRHYEFYVFSTLDRSPDGYGAAVPAFEQAARVNAVVIQADRTSNSIRSDSGMGRFYHASIVHSLWRYRSQTEAVSKTASVSQERYGPRLASARNARYP